MEGTLGLESEQEKRPVGGKSPGLQALFPKRARHDRECLRSAHRVGAWPKKSGANCGFFRSHPTVGDGLMAAGWHSVSCAATQC